MTPVCWTSPPLILLLIPLIRPALIPMPALLATYNPLHHENNEVPLSAMAQDMLTAYKYGWKTSYYQNTYDFKGEEEDVQPAGIAAQLEDDGEDVIVVSVDGVHTNTE